MASSAIYSGEETHTQHNGWNKTSSKHDQSGRNLPLLSSSSRSSAPGTAVADALPAPSHFQKTSLSCHVPSTDGVHKTRDFSNSTVSYVGNLFTSRTPRRSQSSFFFFLKVEGKVESSFFILYTQAFCGRPANLPKGGGGPLRAPSPRPRPLTAPPPASRGAPPLPGQLRGRPAATRRSPQAQGLKTRPG